MSPLRLASLPATCRIDEALHVRVEGLAKGEPIVVFLANAGSTGTVMLSRAEFVATEGDLDLARDAPTSGSYAGVDPMGLFWSRTSHSAADVPPQVGVAADPMTVTLTVEAGGQVLSHAVRRYFLGPGVVATEVSEAGLVGRLFTPTTPTQGGRAVLVVGGSNGGLSWSAEVAAVLAAHGYTALALAYFGLPTLPAALDRVPLEYFERALDWLKARPRVEKDRVGVCGVSRGGELALLLGATFSSVHAVVAYVPSGLLWGAYPFNFHSAWTWRGNELPAAQVTVQEWEALEGSGRMQREPHVVYELILANEKMVRETAIPVEKTTGPILMISGGADGLWPSTALAEVAERRLREHRFPYPFEHLIYPEAGHAIGLPHLMTAISRFKHPVSGEQIDLGGSPGATARASRDAWPRVLAFLAESL
jgi:dienelactone hydrolase